MTSLSLTQRRGRAPQAESGIDPPKGHKTILLPKNLGEPVAWICVRDVKPCREVSEDT